MKFNGFVSSALAAGVLLGSAGLAVAGTPFALYQEAHDPVGTATAITTTQAAGGEQMKPVVVAGPAKAAMGLFQPAVPGDNPFALYRDVHDPENSGTPVAASHIATAEDNAISQIASDPFN